MVFESKDDIKYLIILIKERYNIFIYFFLHFVSKQKKIRSINFGHKSWYSFDIKFHISQVTAKQYCITNVLDIAAYNIQHISIYDLYIRTIILNMMIVHLLYFSYI